MYLQDNVMSGITTDDITVILLLFADDMAILGNSPEDLQKSLDLLKSYCDLWGLEVNIDKTKVMVFRKRGLIRNNEIWFYDNIPLEIVNDFNYLGVSFNYTGSFALNQSVLTGKGLKAMYVLMNYLKKYNFKPKVYCQLFDAFVGSILSYGCEVWGFCKSKEIERIQLKCLKSLFKCEACD